MSKHDNDLAIKGGIIFFECMVLIKLRNEELSVSKSGYWNSNGSDWGFSSHRTLNALQSPSSKLRRSFWPNQQFVSFPSTTGFKDFPTLSPVISQVFAVVWLLQPKTEPGWPGQSSPHSSERLRSTWGQERRGYWNPSAGRKPPFCRDCCCWAES